MKRFFSTHKSLLSVCMFVCLAVCLFTAGYIGVKVYADSSGEDEEIVDTNIPATSNDALCDPTAGDDTTAEPTVGDESAIADGAKAIDKNYHAYYLSADGQVLDRFDITINGDVYYVDGEIKQLAFQIAYPSEFRYQYTIPTNGHWQAYPARVSKVSYLNWFAADFDCRNNGFTTAYYAFPQEEDLLFVYWQNKEGTQYLVASADPNADPSELLSFFDDYIRSIEAN